MMRKSKTEQREKDERERVTKIKNKGKENEVQRKGTHGLSVKKNRQVCAGKCANVRYARPT
jgi:hypothetical protein